MKMRFFNLSLIFAFIGFASNSSVAGQIEYDTWTSNDQNVGNYIFTVEDTTPGFFNYSLTISPWNAEALGIFIDFGDFDFNTAPSVSFQSGGVSLFD